MAGTENVHETYGCLNPAKGDAGGTAIALSPGQGVWPEYEARALKMLITTYSFLEGYKLINSRKKVNTLILMTQSCKCQILCFL